MSSYIPPAETARKRQFLDKTTEQTLAKRWQLRGDVAARDEIVLAHQPLADRIARSWASMHGVDVDDLKADAQVGLLKAAAKFDPDLGWRFSTYARWWILAEVGGACTKPAGGMTPGKSKSDRPYLASLDETITVDDGDSDSTRHEVVADPNALGEDDLLHAIHIDKTRGAILGLDLSLRDRRIAQSRLADTPTAEIAAEAGISRQGVEVIWHSIVDRAAAQTPPSRRKRATYAPLNWVAWRDRPPAELPWCKFSHVSQVEPAWFKAQRWPGDYASFRIERGIEIVAGPAIAPKIKSRWGYANGTTSTGLYRQVIDGRMRISVPATPVASRRRAENKRPRWVAPSRNHAANKKLLVDLKIDGSVDLNITKLPSQPLQAKKAVKRPQAAKPKPSKRRPIVSESAVCEVRL